MDHFWLSEVLLYIEAAVPSTDTELLSLNLKGLNTSILIFTHLKWRHAIAPHNFKYPQLQVGENYYLYSYLFYPFSVE